MSNVLDELVKFEDKEYIQYSSEIDGFDKKIDQLKDDCQEEVNKWEKQIDDHKKKEAEERERVKQKYTKIVQDLNDELNRVKTDIAKCDKQRTAEIAKAEQEITDIKNKQNVIQAEITQLFKVKSIILTYNRLSEEEQEYTKDFYKIKLKTLGFNENTYLKDIETQIESKGKQLKELIDSENKNQLNITKQDLINKATDKDYKQKLEDIEAKIAIARDPEKDELKKIAESYNRRYVECHNKISEINKQYDEKIKNVQKQKDEAIAKRNQRVKELQGMLNNQENVINQNQTVFGKTEYDNDRFKNFKKYANVNFVGINSAINFKEKPNIVINVHGKKEEEIDKILTSVVSYYMRPFCLDSENNHISFCSKYGENQLDLFREKIKNPLSSMYQAYSAANDSDFGKMCAYIAQIFDKNEGIQFDNLKREIVILDNVLSIPGYNKSVLINEILGWTNRPSNGVYFIILDDFEPQEKKEINLPDIKSKMIGQGKTTYYDFVNVEKDKVILVNNEAKNKTQLSINEVDLDSYIKNNAKANKEENSYESINECLKDGYKGKESNKFDGLISIPIGRYQDDKSIADIRFNCNGGECVAYEIIGTGGTGKSKLFDNIIINGAAKYSPKDLTFTIIDFKQGAPLANYYSRKENGVAHVVITQAGENEDAQIVVDYLWNEIKRRMNIFTSTNNSVDLTSYNNYVGLDKRIPSLIVIVDEASILFNVEGDIKQKFQMLLSQSRAAGIYFIFANQTENGRIDDIVQQMPYKKIIFQCNDDTAYKSAFNNDEMRKRFVAFLNKHKRGYAIYNDRETRIAWDGDENGNGARLAYSRKIKAIWGVEANPFVAGDTTANKIQLRAFKELCKDINDEFLIGTNYHTGSLSTIKYNESMPLMLIGLNENAAEKIINSILYNCAVKNIETYYIDGSRNTTNYKIFANKYSNIHAYKEDKDYLEQLKTISDIYQSRNNRRAEYSPIVFIVESLDMIQDYQDNNKLSDNFEEDNNVADDDFFANLRSSRSSNNTSNTSNVISGRATFESLLNINESNVWKNVFIVASMKRCSKDLYTTDKNAILYNTYSVDRVSDVRVKKELKGDSLALIVNTDRSMQETRYYQITGDDN